MDLGVCRAQLFPGDGDRAALLLPGARYVPAAPLLWFAREVLQADGWTVLQVWDEWDRSEDPTSWVSDRVAAGLKHLDYGSPLLVAKSLTTLALPIAVEKALPGVWLTPLLNQDDVRTALPKVSEPTLLVGGTGDRSWDAQFAGSLPGVEVCELEDADHGLQYTNDPPRSIDALKVVTSRISEFIEQLA